MKSFHSEDEFNQFFRNVTLPSIDVKDVVMKRIRQRKVGKPKISTKKRLLIVAILSVLLITVGFTAALHTWELKGPADTSFKYAVLSNDSGKPLPPEEMYINEYKKLTPGEALAIMKVKNNTNNYVHIIPVDIKTDNIDNLALMVGEEFKYPSQQPQGYNFEVGALSYKHDFDFLDMITEARESSADYIFRKLKPTSELSNYSITYRKGLDSLIVSVVFNWHGNTVNSVNTGQKTKIINIKDFEAMYVEHDTYSELLWFENINGKITYCSIRSSNKEQSTLENLIMMAESFQ